MNDKTNYNVLYYVIDQDQTVLTLGTSKYCKEYLEMSEGNMTMIDHNTWVNMGKDQENNYLVLSWGGETHYVNGAGLSTSALLCSLSDRNDELLATAPHRSKAEELQFFSADPPTCKWCQQVAEELTA